MTDFVVFARFFIEFSRKKGGGRPQARLSSRVPVTSASHSGRVRANLAENPARFFESLHPAESKHVWSHQDAPNVTANPALDWRCLFLLHVSSPFLRAEVSAPVYLLRRTISRISGLKICLKSIAICGFSRTSTLAHVSTWGQSAHRASTHATSNWVRFVKITNPPPSLSP